MFQHLTTMPESSPTISLQAFIDLFQCSGDDIILKADKIPYLFPHRFSEIPLDTSSVDTVLSFAVLEHVLNPEKAVKEIFRVLKKGGLAIQRIITQDHRSFSKVEGYHPLSYLEHTPENWKKLISNKFHQNRVVPRLWKDIFLSQGFDLIYFRELNTLQLDPETTEHILSINPDLNKADLSAVNCDVIARKL